MSVVATATIYNTATSVNPNTGEGVGGLGINGIVTEENIRCFLLDSPDANILTAGQTIYNPKQIEQAMMQACGTYNAISPICMQVKLDGSDWPQGIQHLLIMGTASWLLLMTASDQLKNQFNTQDGNVPRVGVHDKYSQYLQFAQTLRQDFKTTLKEWKIAYDMERAFDESSSPLLGSGHYY